MNAENSQTSLVAGDAYTLSGTATWQDAVPLDSGTINCSAEINGRSLTADNSQVGDGTFSCSWTVPEWAVQGQLNTTVTVTDSDGNSGSTQTSAEVKDGEGPLATALAGQGRYGRLVPLRYWLADNSGRARARIDVYSGKRRVKTLRAPFRSVGADKTNASAWRAPARRKTKPGQTAAKLPERKFCVVAVDRAGNQSEKTCGPIRLR